MVKIWNMDNFDQGDPRLPHIAFPPKYITPDRLKKRTGVFLWKLAMDESSKGFEGTITQMEWISKEHKYVLNDTIDIKEGVTPRYMEKIKEWFRPHTHAVEESRLVLDGKGYYDVEDCRTGKWMRILIEKGDFIAIPAGCLHRFTTDTTNHIKMKRFYQTNEGEPHPILELEGSVNTYRTDYVNRFKDEKDEKTKPERQSATS